MAKRIIQEINAGSMADIAFLLLIFFLVTTTMDTDSGITRKLPPEIGDDIKPPVVRDRNILTVLVNRNNQLLVEGENINVTELKTTAKNFILNPENSSDLPMLVEKQFDYLGKRLVTSNHVISLRSDRGTSYSMYITVQNELAAAYKEVKDELAMTRWRKSYNDLNSKYQKVIDEVYPVRISEAEPVNLN